MESLPLTLESLSSDGVDTAQMSLAQDGISNSLRGAGTILGGRIVRPVLSMVTNTQYTLLGNSIGVLFFGLKAAARGPMMMMGSKFIEGFWCNECTCSHSLAFFRLKQLPAAQTGTAWSTRGSSSTLSRQVSRKARRPPR